MRGPAASGQGGVALAPLGGGECRVVGSNGEWWAKRWRQSLSRRRDSEEDKEESPLERSSMEGLEEESGG